MWSWLSDIMLQAIDYFYLHMKIIHQTYNKFNLFIKFFKYLSHTIISNVNLLDACTKNNIFRGISFFCLRSSVILLKKARTNCIFVSFCLKRVEKCFTFHTKGKLYVGKLLIVRPPTCMVTIIFARCMEIYRVLVYLKNKYCCHHYLTLYLLC